MANDSALDVVSKYVVAISSRDSDGMNGLRAEEFVLDFVHGDAFENRPMSAQGAQMFWPIWFDAFRNLPMSAQEAQMFWPTWFDAFPEFDLEVTRTVAADEVVVTQWIFTGTNTGPLEPPIFEERVEPTGRTVSLRGVSVYDVINGRIHRETLYVDLVTLMVELGVDV